MKQVKKQATKKQAAIKSNRTGNSVANLTQAIEDNMFYVQGKFQGNATKNDNYLAVAYTVRDRLLRRWVDSFETYMKDDVRLVCYFSAEFLLGPHLHNNLINLGLLEPMRKAAASYDVKLDDLFEQEEEPGLGNGGLGRLAACYMDSLSSLQISAMAFVMNTASSIRKFSMAGKLKSPINGCTWVIPGSCSVLNVLMK